MNAVFFVGSNTVFQSTKKELSIEEELQGKHIENTRFTTMLKHMKRK